MRESGCILLEPENLAWSEPVTDKKIVNPKSDLISMHVNLNRLELEIFKPELHTGQPDTDPNTKYSNPNPT